MSKDEITLSENQITVLNILLEDMGYQGEWCFYVAPEQDITIYGGYLPAMVFGGVKSYFTMNGPVYGDMPFVIGKTFEEAKARCRLMNQHAKLTDELVTQILKSAGLHQA